MDEYHHPLRDTVEINQETDAPLWSRFHRSRVLGLFPSLTLWQAVLGEVLFQLLHNELSEYCAPQGS